MIKNFYKVIQSIRTLNHTKKNPLTLQEIIFFIQFAVAVRTMDSLPVQWICEIFNKLLSTTPTDPNWLDGLIWLKTIKKLFPS